MLASTSARTAVRLATRRTLDSLCRISRTNMRELFYTGDRSPELDLWGSFTLSIWIGRAFASIKRKSDAIIYTGKHSMFTWRRCASDFEGIDLKNIVAYSLIDSNRVDWRTGFNFRTIILRSMRALRRIAGMTGEN